MQSYNSELSCSTHSQSPLGTNPTLTDDKLKCGHHVKYLEGNTFCRKCINIYPISIEDFKSLFHRNIRHKQDQHKNDVSNAVISSGKDRFNCEEKKHEIMSCLVNKKYFSDMKVEFMEKIENKSYGFVKSCIECLDSFVANRIRANVFYALFLKKRITIDNKVLKFQGDNVVADCLIGALEDFDVFELLVTPKFTQYIIDIIVSTFHIIKKDILYPVAYMKKIELILYIYSYKLDNPESNYPIDHKSIVNYVNSSVKLAIMSELQGMMYANPSLKKSGIKIDDSQKTGKSTIGSESPLYVNKENPPKLRVEKLLLGEEFEYILGGIFDHEIIDAYNKVSRKWLEKIKSRAGILHVTVKIEQGLSIYDSTLIYTVTIGGKWSVKIFLDGSNLEVNTTPYHHNETFQVNEESNYSVYWLMQHFVFDIADELNLKKLSGHKHVDISDSLSGNIELFIRIIIDIQNQTFFPTILGRTEHSNYFSSIKELEDTLWCSSEKIIDLIVNAINTQLDNGKVLWLEEDTTFKRTVDCVKLLSILGKHVFENKYSLCNLLHINDNNNSCSIEIEPSSTMELRFLQCPSSGKECKLINTMLIEWIVFLYKEQQNNERVEHTNSLYTGNQESAKKACVLFLQKIESTISEEEAEVLYHCDPVVT